MRWISLLVMALLVLTTFVGVASAEENKVVNDNFRDIANKYEIGEPISAEDLRILEETLSSSRDMNILTTSTKPFFATGRNSDRTVEADISGTITTVLQTFNHSVSIDMEAYTVRGQVSETRARSHHEAYGVMGSDGVIGKIADITMSSAWNSGNRAELKSSRGFTGAVLWVHHYAYGDFVHPKGTLTVSWP